MRRMFAGPYETQLQAFEATTLADALGEKTDPGDLDISRDIVSAEGHI